MRSTRHANGDLSSQDQGLLLMLMLMFQAFTFAVVIADDGGRWLLSRMGPALTF